MFLTALIIQSVCFREEETIADNSNPSKKVRSHNREKLTVIMAMFNNEDNSSHDSTLYQTLIFCYSMIEKPVVTRVKTYTFIQTVYLIQQEITEQLTQGHRIRIRT